MLFKICMKPLEGNVEYIAINLQVICNSISAGVEVDVLDQDETQ